MRFVNNMRPWHRIVLSGIMALITVLILLHRIELLWIIISAWIVFSIAYLIISWLIFFYRSVDEIRKLATADDGGKVFVFIMIILSSFIGMVMVLLLIISPPEESGNQFLFLVLSISGMLLSWIMVHTIFTFHYAHMYYDNAIDNSKKAAEGLQFPDEKKPDYVDFAYFSFVIGCTFQVSDVTINSRKMRRLVLAHGLLAFLLNTFVIALTINLVAGLGK